MPTDYCDVHEEVKICVESGKIATEHCPETITEARIKGAEGNVTEICDLHIAPEVLPEESPEVPLEPGASENMGDSGNNNSDLIGGGDASQNAPIIPPTTPEVIEPEVPESTVPSPSPEPTLPPVDQNAPPSIDDEESFVIPQS